MDRYAVLAAHLRAMAEALARAQQPDGMWRASLADPAQV
jgi:rhamnogalacturonyl hydrolase YesR